MRFSDAHTVFRSILLSSSPSRKTECCLTEETPTFRHLTTEQRSQHKWGPTGIAGGSSYAPVRLSYQPRPSRRLYDLTSAFLLPAARKRASGIRDAQLFSEFIFGQLMPDVLSYLCLILAHRINIVTSAPELPITIFELQLAELFIYHQAALSFQISYKRRYT